MRLEEALSLRVEQLCMAKNLTDDDLAVVCGVSLSMIETIKKQGSEVKLINLYHLCEALDISLEEFFNSPLFDRESIVEESE